MIGSFDGLQNFAGIWLQGAPHESPINMTAGFQQMARRVVATWAADTANRTPANFGILTETCSPFRDADQVMLCKRRRRRLNARTIGNAIRIAFNCSTSVEKPTWARAHAKRGIATNATPRCAFFIEQASLRRSIQLEGYLTCPGNPACNRRSQL